MLALTDLWCIYCIAELPITFELGQRCPNCNELLDCEQKICRVDHSAGLKMETNYEEN